MKLANTLWGKLNYEYIEFEFTFAINRFFNSLNIFREFFKQAIK